MRKQVLRIWILLVGCCLSGCLSVAQSSFKFDAGTGQFEATYHDIRSQKGFNEDDYSPERDWAALQSVLTDGVKEYDQDVIENVSRGLFQESEILSGKTVERVKCPKCFPSTAAILTMLHDEDWKWEVMNGDIFLIIPAGKKVTSTNGQTLNTAHNTFIAWPEDQEIFEYAIEENCSGESLLRFYQAEQQNGKKQAE